MTANFLLTILTLVAIAVSTTAPRRVLWLVVALGTLVLAYPPFVPLLHFFFELTTDPVILVVRVLLAVLWVLAAARVLRRAARHGGDRRTVLLVVALACATFWGLLGVAVADFEAGGATPGVTSSPLWVVQDVTLWAAVLTALALALLRRRPSVDESQVGRP